MGNLLLLCIPSKEGDIYLEKSDNNISEDARNFCRHYFRYMTSQYSLRVLMAYVYSDSQKADGYRKYPRCNSLYDLIIAYGASGCIHDVFDEYDYVTEFSKNREIRDNLKDDENKNNTNYCT